MTPSLPRWALALAQRACELSGYERALERDVLAARLARTASGLELD